MEEDGGPGPYVSVYAPVWDEWARAARVRARRWEARRLGKTAEARAEVEAREEAEVEAEAQAEA